MNITPAVTKFYDMIPFGLNAGQLWKINSFCCSAVPGRKEEFEQIVSETVAYLDKQEIASFLDMLIQEIKQNPMQATGDCFVPDISDANKLRVLKSMRAKHLGKYPDLERGRQLDAKGYTSAKRKEPTSFEALFRDEAAMFTAIEAAKETRLINDDDKWIAKHKEKPLTCFWFAVKMASLHNEDNLPSDSKAGQIIAAYFGTTLGKNAINKFILKSDIEPDDFFKALLAYMKGKKGS